MDEKPRKISPKTFSALVIITALRRPWGFSPWMVHITAEIMGIYKYDEFYKKHIPSKRTISRIFKELVDAGLLEKKGYKYFPSKKLKELCESEKLQLPK